MRVISEREELKNYLGTEIERLLFELYDGYVRVVDPETNRVELTVANLNENSGQTTYESCFAIWHKQKTCSNCTSLRALLANKPLTKIETKNSLVYLVHSVPFSLENGRKVVLEVIKNLTNVSMASDTLDYPDPDFLTLLRTIDRLNERVYKDVLTDTYNREYLEVKLSKSIAKGNCTVLMLDIDNFKLINDKYGHPVGDLVLRKCVDVIKSKLREHDEIIRYGGDEFIIVLMNISKRKAKDIRTRLEQALKGNPVEYKNEFICCEVSIGSYTVDKPGLTLNEILKKADEAMYRAKRRKKNT